MGATLTTIVSSLAAEWQAVDFAGLQYWRRDVAQLALVGLLAAAVAVLLLRAAIARRPGRHQVVLPAILRGWPASRLAWTRHVPVLLFVAGLPFAVLAVADPYSSLVAENVTYPGRRISLMIDASDSMQTSFKAATLNTRNEVQPAFFTTVAAAQRFVELRRKGKYRDLMALVEFGSRAYVITPFTSDYDNLLLSMALIGDPVEFSMFPESGTVIASALEESIEIFKAFNFLEASGNLMVIFTDGEDTTSIVNGRSLDDILKSAVDNKIPLYFVRTNYDKDFGDGIPDAKWREAVERTGGRYYVAKNEASLLAAVADIDREAVGAIAARQYTSQTALYAVCPRGLCTVDRRRRFVGGHAVVWTDPMKTVVLRLLFAVVLATAAWLSWSESKLAAEVADARQAIATFDFAAADAGQPRASLTDYLPGARRRLADDIVIAKAHAAYWRGRYDTVAAVGADSAADADILLAAANASFRQSRRDPASGPAAVQRLDGVLQAYAAAMKATAVDDGVRSAALAKEAAYNYEFVARLRDQAARTRTPLPAAAGPRMAGDLPAGPTIHGTPGAPPPDAKMEELQTIMPMEYGDREAQPVPTPGAKRERKG